MRSDPSCSKIKEIVWCIGAEANQYKDHEGHVVGTENSDCFKALRFHTRMTFSHHGEDFTESFFK